MLHVLCGSEERFWSSQPFRDSAARTELPQSPTLLVAIWEGRGGLASQRGERHLHPTGQKESHGRSSAEGPGNKILPYAAEGNTGNK